MVCEVTRASAMSAASPDDLIIRVKHSGSIREVQLRAGECPYARIASLLPLPRGAALKLIHRGKLLPPAGTAAAREALVHGELYQLLASDPGAAAPPGPFRRAGDVLVEYYASLPPRPSLSSLSWRAVYSYACSVLLSSVTVVWRFFATMVIAPKPPEPREGPR